MRRWLVFAMVMALAPLARAQAPPTWLGSFGTSTVGPSQMQSPLGLAIDAGGNVWVADVNLRRVRLFSPTGTYLAEPVLPQYETPSGVAVLTTGGLALSSLSSSNLVLLPADFSSWTLVGMGASGFGVVANPAGGCWISQAARFRIVSYPSGQILSCSGQPNGFAVAPDGGLYVALTDRDQIQVLGGAHAGLTWGTTGTAAGSFVRPAGVAIRDDLVFVTDSGNHRVQVFGLDGSFVTQFGSSDPGPAQMLRPAGIAIGPDGTIFIGDLDKHRVSLFGHAPTPVAPSSWGRIKSMFR